MKTAIAITAALIGGTAHAETITFEADGNVLFTRCTDDPFKTICELVFPRGTDYLAYVCIAIDKDGNPIASAVAPDEMMKTSVFFDEVAVSDIVDVKCRLRQSGNSAKQD